MVSHCNPTLPDLGISLTEHFIPELLKAGLDWTRM